jgi:hypothetical protein
MRMRVAKRIYRRWLLMPSHDKLPWKTSTLQTAIARRLEQYERRGRVSDRAW